MGNWHISIQGVGCHHNSVSSETDANNMAKDFIKQLKTAGHKIQQATFTCGSAETLVPIDIHETNISDRDYRTKK